MNLELGHKLWDGRDAKGAVEPKFHAKDVPSKGSGTQLTRFSLGLRRLISSSKSDKAFRPW